MNNKALNTPNSSLVCGVLLCMSDKVPKVMKHSWLLFLSRRLLRNDTWHEGLERGWRMFRCNPGREGGGCCWRRQAIPTTTHDGNIDNRLPVALNDVKDLLASIKCVLASIWHTTRNLHTLFQRLLPLLLLACTHSLTHCRVHRIIVIPAKWRAIISTVELVCLHRKFALNPHCIVSSSSSSTYAERDYLSCR